MRIDVKVTSRWMYLLRTLLAVCVGSLSGILVISPEEDNQWLFLLVAAPIIFFLFWLTRNFDKGVVRMEMDQEGVSFLWQKQLRWQQQPDRVVRWEDIERHRYKFNTRAPDEFRLYMRQDQDVRFFFGDTPEEFHDFYTNLEAVTQAMANDPNALKTIDFQHPTHEKS